MNLCPHCDKTIQNTDAKICPHCKNPLDFDFLSDDFTIDDFDPFESTNVPKAQQKTSTKKSVERKDDDLFPGDAGLPMEASTIDLFEKTIESEDTTIPKDNPREKATEDMGSFLEFEDNNQGDFLKMLEDTSIEDIAPQTEKSIPPSPPPFDDTKTNIDLQIDTDLLGNADPGDRSWDLDLSESGQDSGSSPEQKFDDARIEDAIHSGKIDSEFSFESTFGGGFEKSEVSIVFDPQTSANDNAPSFLDQDELADNSMLELEESRVKIDGIPPSVVPKQADLGSSSGPNYGNSAEDDQDFSFDQEISIIGLSGEQSMPSRPASSVVESTMADDDPDNELPAQLNPSSPIDQSIEISLREGREAKQRELVQKKEDGKKGEHPVIDTSAYFSEDRNTITIPFLKKKISRDKFLLTIVLFVLLVTMNSAIFVFYRLKSTDGFSGYIYTGGKLRKIAEIKLEKLKNEYNIIANEIKREFTSWSYKDLDAKIKRTTVLLKSSPKHLNINLLQKEIEFLTCYLSPSENQSKRKGLEEFAATKANTIGVNPIVRKKYQGYLEILKGDYKHAAEFLKSYMEEDYSDFTVRYFLGYALMKQEDFITAQATFSKLLTDFPKRYQSYLGLGLLYEATKDDPKALANFSKAYEMTENDIEPLIALAHFHEKHYRYEKAIHYHNIAVDAFLPYASNNQIGKIYSDIAAIYFVKDNLDEGIKELKKAASVDNYNPEYPYQLGIVLTENFQFEEAVPFFKQAYEIDPHTLKYPLALVKTYIDNSQYLESDNLLRTLMEKNSDNVELYYHRGLNYLMLDETEKAKQDFDKAQSLDPNHVLTNIALGDYFFYDENNFEKADEHYKKALTLAPENYLANFHYGRFLSNGKKETIESKKYLLKSLKLKRNLSPAYNLIGEIYFSLKDYESAFPYFRSALKYDSKNVGAMINIALIHKNEKHYDKASQQLEAVLAIDSENSQAKALYTEILFITEKDPEKLPTYQKMIDEAIKLDPENDYAYYLKGYFYELQKNYTEAANLYIYAMKFNPSDINYRSRLAQVYLATGNYTKALPELNEVLKIQPNNIKVLGLKAKMFTSNNQLDSARAIYETIVRLSPFDSEAHLQLGQIFKILNEDGKAFKYLNQGVLLFERQNVNSKSLPLDKRLPVCQALIELSKLTQGTKPKTALTWLRKSSEVCPEWPTNLKYLGYFYKSQSNYPRAIEYFNQYLDSDPIDKKQISEELYFLKQRR